MEIKARVPGKIDEIKVKVGDEVKKGDVVLIMEAMKMKQPFAAPEDAVVKEIKVSVGERVSQGDVMVVLE
ncbi:MAG TPA: biotin/lipoyl-binding protein [Clostridia bacterium]|jgi:biotin carboxyl carrier protein|nr:biotin/lipoyl-binding protein [Clostridia bacterium]